MAQNILMHAWDAITKRVREVQWVGGAAAVAQAFGGFRAVAPGANTQVLGTTGAAGDFLGQLICVVNTPASAQVQIKNGTGAAVTVYPNIATGGVPGTYVIPIGLRSTLGAWQVTTGAGVEVIACGSFT